MKNAKCQCIAIPNQICIPWTEIFSSIRKKILSNEREMSTYLLNWKFSVHNQTEISHIFIDSCNTFGANCAKQCNLEVVALWPCSSCWMERTKPSRTPHQTEVPWGMGVGWEHGQDHWSEVDLLSYTALPLAVTAWLQCMYVGGEDRHRFLETCAYQKMLI